MNIKGVKTKVYFEVIETMDESYTYSSLIGIDWEFENNVALNLKERKMSYGTNNLRLIKPLYFNEGNRYNEPMNEVS